MEKHLHIISLDVPYPVTYGGVYDLFYKLPALQAQGVKIHLHCFDYRNGEQPELNKYCTSVKYYKRNMGYKSISMRMPYIVFSRKNEQLLNELLKDDYPVLIEGIHCSFPVVDERFFGRNFFLRLHNVEHEYYQQLFHCNASVFKKLYYWLESKLLKNYEQSITYKVKEYWSVSLRDLKYYQQKFNCTNIRQLPLFIPDNWKVESAPGIGVYAMYHGNLQVAENEKAAVWLITKVFNDLKIPFVIAGKNPSTYLKKLVHRYAHIYLKANPDEGELKELIKDAHLHVLPSFNITGIKIKVLNALYHGRHCIVNNDAVDGSGIADACHVSNTAASMKLLVEQLYQQAFTVQEIEMRRQLLDEQFNNTSNAKKLINRIWTESSE